MTLLTRTLDEIVHEYLLFEGFSLPPKGNPVQYFLLRALFTHSGTGKIPIDIANITVNRIQVHFVHSQLLVSSYCAIGSTTAYIGRKATRGSGNYTEYLSYLFSVASRSRFSYPTATGNDPSPFFLKISHILVSLLSW